MSDSQISKLENPIRIAELDPKNTLIKSGLKENMILCDIGAGTGIFSFPATQISSNDIYALEINDSMIELLKSRTNMQKIPNLKILKINSSTFPLENGICDMVIMVTVLHEIENKELMLYEIKRVLKEKGKLLIIEFNKRETPMGPPIDNRISEEYVKEICINNGFKTIDKIILGDNFYSLVFESVI